MKVKKLTLAHTHSHGGWRRDNAGNICPYRVEKVCDSVDYVPGDVLSKDEVASLCRNQAWSVIIVPEPDRR